MDSTNLFQSQHGWVGHIPGGIQQPSYLHPLPHPYRDLSTIRAIHNDMLVYHTNKLHVVKVPVVVQDQLDAIPVVHAFNDGLALQAPYSGKCSNPDY